MGVLVILIYRFLSCHKLVTSEAVKTNDIIMVYHDETKVYDPSLNSTNSGLSSMYLQLELVS